jgi:hypothetical protein
MSLLLTALAIAAAAILTVGAVVLIFLVRWLQLLLDDLARRKRFGCGPPTKEEKALSSDGAPPVAAPASSAAIIPGR